MIERLTMRSRTMCLLRAFLILPAALAPLLFICGCTDDTQTTGTTVTRPPGAEEARQKSIEQMKAMMKNQPKR
jgi:hypothetical protein